MDAALAIYKQVSRQAANPLRLEIAQQCSNSVDKYPTDSQGVTGSDNMFSVDDHNVWLHQCTNPDIQ